MNNLDMMYKMVSKNYKITTISKIGEEYNIIIRNF